MYYSFVEMNLLNSVNLVTILWQLQSKRFDPCTTHFVIFAEFGELAEFKRSSILFGKNSIVLL